MELLNSLDVENSIGSGSNATVLLVRSHAQGNGRGEDDNVPTDRPLALKVMSHFWDESAKKLLDCERQALQTIPPHPSVIRVFKDFSAAVPEQLHAHLSSEMVTATARAHTTQFFLMEYHPATLDSWRFVWPSPMPYHILWRIARDLVDVLSHLQAEGISHLDLKLDNVLLAYSGRAILTDFGISKVFGPGSPMMLQYCEPFGLLMNRLVLSPEVLQAYDRSKELYRRYMKACAKQAATPAKAVVTPARLTAAVDARRTGGTPVQAPRVPIAEAALTTPSGNSSRPTDIQPPSPRELAVHFGAQAIWAVGAMLYELATGYGHEPGYPEESGGMRDGWSNCGTWPAPPMASTGALMALAKEQYGDNVPGDAIVHMPDGSYRRILTPGVTPQSARASACYPPEFAALMQSMLASDPNQRITIVQAAAVLDALAPQYVPAEGKQPSDSPHGRLTVAEGSYVHLPVHGGAAGVVSSPSKKVSHAQGTQLVAVPLLPATPKGAEQLKKFAGRRESSLFGIISQSVGAFLKGEPHVPLVPVLVRHWNGSSKLVKMPATARVGHVLSAWNAKNDVALAVPYVTTVGGSVAGTALAFEEETGTVTAAQSRWYLGGYELSQKAVVGHLVKRLAPLDARGAPQGQDAEEDAWSDEETPSRRDLSGGGEGVDLERAADEEPYNVTARAKRGIARILALCGGVMVLDIAPSAGLCATLSSQVHVECIQQACKDTAWATFQGGNAQTAVCQLPVPDPLLVCGDDAVNTCLRQPLPLQPSFHAPLPEGALPNPLPAQSLPVQSSISNSLFAAPGSAKRLSSPTSAEAADDSATLHARAAAQSCLSAVSVRELSVKWMRSYASDDTHGGTPPARSPQAIGVCLKATAIDMRAGLMYRCLLALTGLSNTALREPGCGFPFVACSELACLALGWFPHRHEVVAAAAGLLRNVSCTEDSEHARVMVCNHGALRALVCAYFSPWPTASAADRLDQGRHAGFQAIAGGQPDAPIPVNFDIQTLWRIAGENGVTKHHGTDVRVAEDVVLACSNLLRFDEMQKPHTHTPIYGLAAMVTDALKTGKASSSSVQTVHDSGARLLRYLLAVEGILMLQPEVEGSGQLAGSDSSEGDEGQTTQGRAMAKEHRVTSAMVASAASRGGCMYAMAHALNLFGHDKALVHNALHVMCTLLVHSFNRTLATVPVTFVSDAVVCALSKGEHADDTAILGLGATVVRNLACITHTPGDGEGEEQAVGPAGGDGLLDDTPFASISFMPPDAAQDSPDFSPALAVAAAGAPAVLEDIMGRHPNAYSIQENGRCALYNLLLLGSADAKSIAESAAAAQAEVQQLKTRLEQLQKEADKATQVAQAMSSTLTLDGVVHHVPDAAPSLEGSKRGTLLTGSAAAIASPLAQSERPVTAQPPRVPPLPPLSGITAEDVIGVSADADLLQQMKPLPELSGRSARTARMASVHRASVVGLSKPAGEDVIVRVDVEEVARKAGVSGRGESGASARSGSEEGAGTTARVGTRRVSVTQVGASGQVVLAMPEGTQTEQGGAGRKDSGAGAPAAVSDWGATASSPAVSASSGVKADDLPGLPGGCTRQFTTAFWLVLLLLLGAIVAAVLGFVLF